MDMMCNKKRIKKVIESVAFNKRFELFIFRIFNVYVRALFFYKDL